MTNDQTCFSSHITAKLDMTTLSSNWIEEKVRSKLLVNEISFSFFFSFHYIDFFSFTRSLFFSLRCLFLFLMSAIWWKKFPEIEFLFDVKCLLSFLLNWIYFECISLEEIKASKMSVINIFKNFHTIKIFRGFIKNFLLDFLSKPGTKLIKFLIL